VVLTSTRKRKRIQEKKGAWFLLHRRLKKERKRKKRFFTNSPIRGIKKGRPGTSFFTPKEGKKEGRISHKRKTQVAIQRGEKDGGQSSVHRWKNPCRQKGE